MINNSIYVARIAHSTAVDGVGLRNALYVSGCNIQCPACHNKAFWDIKSGTKRTLQDVFEELNEDDCNISILGGEPLMQYDAVLKLCKMIKKKTHKTIWLWSGHTVEEIRAKYPEILHYIDVLVDGPFISALYEPNLQWRGSTNQRVISVEQTFKNTVLLTQLIV